MPQSQQTAGGGSEDEPLPAGEQVEARQIDADVPVVELEGITKHFPGVLANDRISLSVGRGEILCLLGENGAGKSTLMNILSGMLAPDAGSIRINGDEVEITDPRRALDLGIGMVYQHSTLVPTLKVLENLMLGAGDGYLLKADEARERLEELARMLGAEVDPSAITGELSLGEQQVIEIIKALWKGTTILILDEPTSMLTPRGVEELAKMLTSLKEHGLAIIFITHKLHEALHIGDRITVLRQGRVAGDLSPAELRSLDTDEIQNRVVRMMFGEDLSTVGDVAELSADMAEVGAHSVHEADSADAAPDVVLTLKNISLPPSGSSHGLHDVDLEVRSGEILGVAGVDGNGQRELAEVIAGQRSPQSGEVRLRTNGTQWTINNLSIQGRQRLGLRYLTDDRMGEGTARHMSVAINLLLKRVGQKPFWKRGVIRHDAVRAHAEAAVREHDVRTPSSQTPVASLSGGNIQKVLLARELAFEPRLVVYNKPTHGLDLRTTQVVRARIREQARSGTAAIVISTSLDELLELADRIAVISKGRVTGIVENAPGVEERIGELMVGEI